MIPRSREKKGAPFSIRLSESTERYVVEEARLSGRSKSAVVQELTEEAARMRRFPGIAFRENLPGVRDAYLKGTALDIWQICEAYRDFDSIDAMVAGSDLNEPQIRVALAYWKAFPEEIDQAIADNNRPLEELQEMLPSMIVARLND